MTPLEKELVDATGVKVGKNRQEGLKSMIRAVEKLPPDDYEALTDEAVDWYEAGVAAMNDKQKVPDFDAEADESRDAVAGETEDDEAVSEADEGGTEEGTADSEADTGAVEAAEEAPSRAKKAKPSKKAAKQPQVPLKKTAKRPPPPLPTGAKNRYGIYEGTQLDAAIKMFEKGCTMADVKRELGETKYNLIHRLIREGHKVEKVEGKFQLTHKDDAAKGKKKK